MVENDRARDVISTLEFDDAVVAPQVEFPSLHHMRRLTRSTRLHMALALNWLTIELRWNSVLGTPRKRLLEQVRVYLRIRQSRGA